MSDMISRQAAIEALQRCRKHCVDPFDSYHIDIQEAELQLSKLPSAQPERKKGKWLKAYGDHEAFGVRPFYRYCSECNESTVWAYNYCPNCGARMAKGEEHERGI